jgi:hypothetical protein
LRALALALAVSGCAASGSRATPDAGAFPCFACIDGGDASGPAAIKVVLRSTCAYGGVELSCHGVGSGGLTLGTADDLAQIIGVASTERPEMVRVAPGQPAASYLYLKLAGDGGIEGGPMPGGVTDPRLVALFGEWIDAGAAR